jgi:hypothetical protein
MYKIKEIVSLPEWQSVRKTLIGQWKKNPKWAVAQLEEFLGSIEGASDRKLRILLNYLTGSGFRSGLISHFEITELRERIRKEIRRRNFRPTV